MRVQTIPNSLAEGIVPPATKKRRVTGNLASSLGQADHFEPALSASDVQLAIQAILPDALQSAVALLLPALLQAQPEIQELLTEMSKTSNAQRDLVQVAQSTQTGYDSLAVGGSHQACLGSEMACLG